jgi:hypothetical protein
MYASRVAARILTRGLLYAKTNVNVSAYRSAGVECPRYWPGPSGAEAIVEYPRVLRSDGTVVVHVVRDRIRRRRRRQRAQFGSRRGACGGLWRFGGGRPGDDAHDEQTAGLRAAERTAHVERRVAGRALSS